MPGITVIDNDGDLQRFAEAETWHVDDRGQLHVKTPNDGPAATFAKDCWQGVGTYDANLQELRNASRSERKAPRELPLRIVKGAGKYDAYSIKLGGLELSSVLLSDGFKVEFKSFGDGPSQPEITMVFAPGALDVDLDADLVKYLRSLPQPEPSDPGSAA